MEELYINNKKIDLGDATVTLNHKSNFNGDLSSIQASNSQTIKLPKTENNRAALDCPDIPSYGGSCLRRYNDARFYRNGIELFRGFAVLLSSGEDFEVCLSWGTLSALTEFLNQDDALNEYLDDGTTIKWNLVSYVDAQYGGYYMNNRIEANELGVPIHPSMYVSDILARIQSKSGLVFKFPDDITSWLADKKVLCNTRMCSPHATNSMMGTMVTQGIGETDTAAKLVYIGWNGINQNYSFDLDDGNDILMPNANMSVILFNPHLTVKTSGDTEFRMWLSVYDGKIEEGGKFLNSVQFTVTSKNNYSAEGTSIVLYDIPDRCCLYLTYDYDFSRYVSSISGTIDLICDCLEEGGFGEVPFPGYFPVFINLPDIKLKDFMKDIAAITGTFPHRAEQDPANQITFSPFDILYDNKAKAVDWSDKLLYKGAPQEMEYQYGDMAQQNWLQYAESEDAPVSRASITVQDETLEKEAELYTLSFAATETTPQGVAVIHMYDKDNDGAWQHTDTEPRFCSTFKNTQNLTYLGFTGMGFPDIVASRYQGYQHIFGQPVVLREDFRLTEIDLRNIDYTIPVYLRQYGRFYAIIQIQDTGGTCKVELLQLN